MLMWLLAALCAGATSGGNPRLVSRSQKHQHTRSTSAAVQGLCFLRSDVDLSKCTVQQHVDTLTLTSPGTWTDHPNTNCFTGHGATSLSSPTGHNYTASSCEAVCLRNPNCSAVVIAWSGRPGNYSYNGYLGSGSFQGPAHLLEVSMHTTASAQARCNALPTCIGFTFIMEECRLRTGGRWFNGTQMCTEPTRTWFTSRIDSSNTNNGSFYRYWNCGRSGECHPTGGTGCVIPPGAIPPGSTPGQLMPPRAITGPARAQWLHAAMGWRKTCQAEQRYNGSIYHDRTLEWTQTSWIQPQVHPYDNFIFDHISRNWTVGKYLNDLKERFGGIDSVLLWPTYTNLGIDSRNQYDLLRHVPGGVDGLRTLVHDFHAHGVRVLLPFNPWDTSTRRELCGDSPGPIPSPGCAKRGVPMADADALAALLIAVDADGFNGDTMHTIPRAYLNQARARGHTIAMSPEKSGFVTNLNYDTLAWGEGWQYSIPPKVDLHKWLSNGKHNVQICDRWLQNKVPMVATALFNGVGLESWENIWGVFNGITPRDQQLIKRLSSLLRFVGGTYAGAARADPASNRSLLRSGGWIPFSPAVTGVGAHAYASTWPGPTNTGAGTHTASETLFTVVAFGSQRSTATMVLPPEIMASSTGHKAFDLWHGVELNVHSNGTIIFEMEADLSIRSPAVCNDIHATTCKELPTNSACVGVFSRCAAFGAVLLTSGGVEEASLQAYLAVRRQITATSLCDYACESPQCDHICGDPPKVWPFYESCTATQCAGLLQRMDPIAPTRLHSHEPTSPPGARMVRLSGTGRFHFITQGTMIEGSTSQGVDVQFPFESAPRFTHSSFVAVPDLWVDRFPVTNADFWAFLQSSSYQPTDPERFLEQWSWGREGNSSSDHGPPPAGTTKQPVTTVSIEDARAFCAHFGKRLPHTWEWNWLAGQHVGDSRPYPWGTSPPSQNTTGRPVEFHCSEVRTAQAPSVDGPTRPLCGERGNLTSSQTYAGPRDVDALPAGCSPAGICDLIGNTWEMTDSFSDQHTRSVVLKGGSNYRPVGAAYYFPQAWNISLHSKYFLFGGGYERSATIGFRCVAEASA